MNNKLIFKKILLITYITMLLSFIILGVYNYISDITMGVGYWGTLIVLLGCIPSAIEIKNKDLNQ